MITKSTERWFTHDDLMQLEQRFRAAMINSLTGFKSLALIGSIDQLSQINVAVFNSIIHIGANPPYIGFISRPDSVDRHTLENIEQTGFYTINHVRESFYMQAHQTSARYPKNISEFDATKLKPEFKDGFIAPFVGESSIKMGVSFKERLDIKLNGTVLIIGQIEQVYLPMNCLSNDGFVDIEKAGTITCVGLDSYHSTKKINRLNYAKPNENVTIKQIN